MNRLPAVAGRFYPSDPKELAELVDGHVQQGAKKSAALGCVVPHAGLMYSGHVAGSVYSSIEIPTRCILLGPRHFPRGESMAILSEGSWQTPFGAVAVDSTLADELMRAYARLREDAVAHEREHSLEVQLPFLQRMVSDLRFVPIVIGTDRYPVIEELGRAVAQVIQAQTEKTLIIASSDMNHYETDVVTRGKDQRAIERILALDPRGLYDTVRAEGITMCGYAPTVAMLVAAIELGAKTASLIRYATSGDITGEYDSVVGYAGIVVR
jgi:MEMO1 family protein